jgi:hypothetical protein
MLPKLKIATPCPADWNKMIGDDKVRFCSQCNLNVYNLSAMSEPEALRVLKDPEGRLCARMYQRADGTILTQDCPVGVRAKFRRLTRFATAALAMIFIAPFARAQRIPINPPEAIVQFETTNQQIHVHVVNQLGDAVRDAAVELQDKSFNTVFNARTDHRGNAHLPLPVENTYILVVRAPLLMTYSKILVVGETTVTVEAGPMEVMGGGMGMLAEQNPGEQLTPMPLRGIPDYRRNSPNSVR